MPKFPCHSDTHVNLLNVGMLVKHFTTPLALATTHRLCRRVNCYLFVTNVFADYAENTRGHCYYRPRRGHMFIVNHWVLPFDPIGVVPFVHTIYYKHVIPLGLGFCLDRPLVHQYHNG